MAYNLQRFVNSSYSIRLVTFLGRTFPVPLGEKVAEWIADRISSRKKSKLVRTVRANQWVVRGEKPDKETLDRATRETFRNIARSLYSLYHYLNDHEAIRRLIVFDDYAQKLFQRPEFSDRGLMVVGMHTSNFALVLQWFSIQELKPLVLTIPDPKDGGRVEFELRKKSGMNLVPASINTVRQAIAHLKKGGVVVTGIDRPIPNPPTRPLFFGRPAALPIHHTFIARQAGVPVVVFGINQLPDGRYHVVASDLIEMEPFNDRQETDRLNAEKALAYAEHFIKKSPEQWSISLPVWPEAIDLAP